MVFIYILSLNITNVYVALNSYFRNGIKLDNLTTLASIELTISVY